MLAPKPAVAMPTVKTRGSDITGRLPNARRDLGGQFLQLQRSHGNHFVQRLVARSAPGPAAAPGVPLLVGATHDPAETAADQIADAVADGWPSTAGPQLAIPAAGPPIHRRAAAPAPGGPLDAETSHAVGAAQQAGGAPLGAATRSHMETALGADLSGVRVHADAGARDLCDTVRAHAFTFGQHVFFRRGLPDIGNAAGRRLLAHELAHVTQPSPQTVIRRTYLDGGEDWIASTTHRRAGGSVRGRSTALGRVDDAVATVRQAYAAGYLPGLSEDLKALRDAIAEWRRTRPGRMRGAQVDTLYDQATELKLLVDGWQGIAFKQKRADHQQQLDKVEGWLDEGSRFGRDTRLRNSVEWVRRGRTPLYVLTETADREYRAKLLLGREVTAQDATYFPDPNSGRGAVGHGTAKTHMYNPADAMDRTNVVVNKRINGWNTAGYIALTENGTDSRELFFQTLRHEVQHAADKHRGPQLSLGVDTAVTPEEQEFQQALRRYKTEYRAHSYQDGPAIQTPAGADTRGRQWGGQQFAVFEHIRTDYPAIQTAVGGDQPTADNNRFITAAHAYRNPDTEGFNKYNSIRIDDLYLALREVPRDTHDATHQKVVALLTAARALNYSDAAYIRAGSAGTNTREEAFMLRALIYDRLDGAALDAFIDTVRRIMDPGLRPPRRKEKF